MKNYTIDLHMHSMLSDGKATPAEVVRAAAEAGLKKICITDHNCVHENYQLLRDYAKGEGVEVLSFSGCEASVVYYEGDRPKYTFHMLIYGSDEQMKSKKFSALFADVFKASDAFAEKCIKSLAERGIYVTSDELFMLDCDIAPCEKRDKLCEDYHINKIADKLGTTTGELYHANVDVFRRYGGGVRGRLLSILRYPDVSRVLEAAQELGLVTVMAHPTWCDPVFACDEHLRGHGYIAELIEHLASLGLDGLEVSHEIVDRHGSADMLKALADKLGLITTGGSDYHAEEEYGCHLTVYGTTEDELCALVKRLEEKRAQASV